MKILKKAVIVLFLIILIIPLFNAQQIVEVKKDEKNKNIFLAPFELLKSPLVWGIILFVVIGIIIIIIIIFGLLKLIKYIKLRNDIFYKLKTERIKLAKAQRRYPSKHWWKIEKNTPIRFVKKVDGKLIVSNPIAYHRGDYMTHEGNYVIAMAMKHSKVWFIFPKIDLLIIPNKEKLEIQQKKGDTKQSITFDKLPKAEDIIQFNENDILLFAESISNTGMFYIPVLKSPEGKVVDISMPVYHTLKNVVLNDFLYEQTSDFGQITKEAVNINPNVRIQQKLGDNSSNVEIPRERE
jgi:hypothetical protein